MRIAILGATSQIAKDLVLSFNGKSSHELMLYARRPKVVTQWLTSVGLDSQNLVADFSDFKTDQHFDAVINFVGVGNPVQAAELGASIFDVTHQYDEIALSYVRKHPNCRYIFLSSGAAYCSSFDEPVNEKTKANIDINNLQTQDWYGLAKLHAECKHRALAQMSIVDVRMFNYFSHTQDMEAKFLITDIIQAIRNGSVLQTSETYIVRDYIHPSDFYGMVNSILSSAETNTVVDCYSRAPIDNLSLLSAMNEHFGLKYESIINKKIINATGSKSHYYSINRAAAKFNYTPQLSSLDGVLQEAQRALVK